MANTNIKTQDKVYTNSAKEFPKLAAQNLFASTIEAVGNCMFAALSDQLYGHQNEHYAIRTKVVQYMRDHQEEFIQFIEVNKGGGTRRNARRSASRVTSPELSPEDFTLQYRNYLANMAQLGVKGDNQELRAFACIFDVNVTVHMPQKDNDLIVYGGSGEFPHVHVAYHKTAEHYSSVRKINATHVPLLAGKEDASKLPVAVTITEPKGMVFAESSVDSTTVHIDDIHIVKSIEPVDDVVYSFTKRKQASYGAASRSSSDSTERDEDSDDEDYEAPIKKNGRAVKAARPTKKGISPSPVAEVKVTAVAGRRKLVPKSQIKAVAEKQSKALSRNTSAESIAPEMKKATASKNVTQAKKVTLTKSAPEKKTNQSQADKSKRAPGKATRGRQPTATPEVVAEATPIVRRLVQRSKLNAESLKAQSALDDSTESTPSDVSSIYSAPGTPEAVPSTKVRIADSAELSDDAYTTSATASKVQA